MHMIWSHQVIDAAEIPHTEQAHGDSGEDQLSLKVMRAPAEPGSGGTAFQRGQVAVRWKIEWKKILSMH